MASAIAMTLTEVNNTHSFTISRCEILCATVFAVHNFAPKFNRNEQIRRFYFRQFDVQTNNGTTEVLDIYTIIHYDNMRNTDKRQKHELQLVVSFKMRSPHDKDSLTYNTECIGCTSAVDFA